MTDQEVLAFVTGPDGEFRSPYYAGASLEHIQRRREWAPLWRELCRRHGLGAYACSSCTPALQYAHRILKSRIPNA